MRMWVVTNEFEVLVLEVEDALHVRVYLHCGQRTGLTCQLQAGLLQVVQIQMSIACGMDKLTRLQSAYLCHHHTQQGIRCDVERYIKEGVSSTRIELYRQLAGGHVELE